MTYRLPSLLRLSFIGAFSCFGGGCASQELHCGLELTELERVSPPVVFRYSGPLGDVPENLAFYSLGQSSETITLVGCGGSRKEQWRVDTVVTVPMEEPLPFSFDSETARSSLIVQKTSTTHGSVERSALDERIGIVRRFDPTVGAIEFELEGSNYDHSARFFMSAEATLRQELLPAHDILDGRWALVARSVAPDSSDFETTMELDESAVSSVGGPVRGVLCPSSCDGEPVSGEFVMPTLELNWADEAATYSLNATWSDDTQMAGRLARRRGGTLDSRWDVTLTRL